MTIKRFEFRDRLRGWELTPMTFEQLNLLVGVSGAGKTTVLDALGKVCNSSEWEFGVANGCEWSIEIETEGHSYLWEARTACIAERHARAPEARSQNGDGGRSSESPHFESESLTVDHDEKLIQRTKDSFRFAGNPLPEMKKSESAIGILSPNERIAPLHRALQRCRPIEDERLGYGLVQVSETVEIRNSCVTFKELRDKTFHSFRGRSYILYKYFPDEFDRLVRKPYLDIFPMIADICVAPLSLIDRALADLSPETYSDLLSFGIMEHGSADWIEREGMSSGMLRTLSVLLDLALAPEGSTFLIDEFENSLGINCLPEVSDLILSRAGDLQFIITSHHPYIINNIPTKYWKLVTRQGSKVTVKDASEIPALQTNSAHDRYTLLCNLTEYEEGVS